MIKKVKNSLIVTSVVFFIIGVIMIIFPEKVSDFTCYLIASMFIFIGVSGIVMYAKTQPKTPYISSTLILAILLGAFGLYIFLNPRSFISFIPLVFGIFLVADSISKLSAAIDLKKMNYSGWWHMLISAFIVLGLGLLIIVNPFKAISLSIMIIGIILIYDSLANIFTVYSYSNAVKKVEKKVIEADSIVITKQDKKQEKTSD